jgi:hypothetical protein
MTNGAPSATCCIARPAAAAPNGCTRYRAVFVYAVAAVRSEGSTIVTT